MKNATPLFGACYSVRRFDAGDTVPVGGTSSFESTANIGLQADFETMEPFFKAVEKARDGIDQNSLASWLKDTGIHIPPPLFASLWATQTVMDKMYPDISARADADRNSFYAHGKQPKVSEIIEGKAAMCAEIALLANEALNRLGVANDYQSGHVLWNTEHEFSEAHSFIVITDNDNPMIYDPANPVATTAGKMPSLFPASPEQMAEWKAKSARQTSFVVLNNALTKAEAAYGVSDGTNIMPERQFVYPATPGKPTPIAQTIPKPTHKK